MRHNISDIVLTALSHPKDKIITCECGEWNKGTNKNCIKCNKPLLKDKAEVCECEEPGKAEYYQDRDLGYCTNCGKKRIEPEPLTPEQRTARQQENMNKPNLERCEGELGVFSNGQWVSIAQLPPDIGKQIMEFMYPKSKLYVEEKEVNKGYLTCPICQYKNKCLMGKCSNNNICPHFETLPTQIQEIKPINLPTGIILTDRELWFYNKIQELIKELNAIKERVE